MQLTCRWLHANRRPAVLLKIDLTRAFDSVAWPFLLEACPFLLEMLEHAGFPLRWIDWISAMMATVSTRVLVNEHPNNRIYQA